MIFLLYLDFKLSQFFNIPRKITKICPKKKKKNYEFLMNITFM